MMFALFSKQRLMANGITLADIDKAVKVFQDGINSWEEYGVTDGDARDGILRALRSLALLPEEVIAGIEASVAFEKEAQRYECALRREAYNFMNQIASTIWNRSDDIREINPEEIVANVNALYEKPSQLDEKRG